MENFFLFLGLYFLQDCILFLYVVLFISVSLFISAMLFFLLILSISSTVLTFCLCSYALEYYPWFLSQLFWDMSFFLSKLQFECMEGAQGKSTGSCMQSLLQEFGFFISWNFVKCTHSRFTLPNLDAAYFHCSCFLN